MCSNECNNVVWTILLIKKDHSDSVVQVAADIESAYEWIESHWHRYVKESDGHSILRTSRHFYSVIEHVNTTSKWESDETSFSLFQNKVYRK
jgi:hypothetical protein